MIIFLQVCLLTEFVLVLSMTTQKGVLILIRLLRLLPAVCAAALTARKVGTWSTDSFGRGLRLVASTSLSLHSPR